jgi:hypothetical protein
VGGNRAPAGPEVTAVVNVTVPLKPPVDVAVMVDVFPVVAPALTVSGVPVMMKLGVPGLLVTSTMATAADG